MDLGRLLQATLDLLKGADIQFRRENRLDIALVKNLPIALVFLPAADIPTFVGEGQVDLGITGQDQVAEHDARVEATRRALAESGKSTPVPEAGLEKDAEKGVVEIMDLSFGACKLQVQVPEKGTYTTPSDLIGKNIGTSFVHLAEDFFAKLEEEQDKSNGVELPTKRKLKTTIIELSGSVEAACALGVADGIVDLVESGETMRAAGLKAIDTVVSSSAVLVRSKKPSNQALYNIERSRLASATAITPGKRAPTIQSLDEEGWVAVSSMVEKKNIATVMDQLTEVGGKDILVLEIANTRTE
ncbi:hypothetical protein DH86_00000933 [Scytalidium sp. 3C]|nr:hypothetical protein DH86_00000933 [Scytalidium sp. 3C]